MGRPELRERVLPDPARHLSVDPAAAVGRAGALDRWKELGADGVVVGTVRKTADRGRRAGPADPGGERRVGARQGIQRQRSSIRSTTAPRLRAHHRRRDPQAAARAARRRPDQARVRLRSRRRAHEGAGRPTATSRTSTWPDYDGAQPAAHHRSPRRSTSRRSGRPTAARSPTRRGAAAIQDIIVLVPLRRRRLQNPAKGTSASQNFLPAWSPDGTKLAFTSNRDGNPEIYVDEPRRQRPARLTNHPDDRRHADLVADRARRSRSPRTAPAAPQIYIVNVDGTGLQQITSESCCDRPTWSPAPFNEIAYASRVGRRPRHQDLRLRAPAARARSPTASAATRARRSRRTAATSRSSSTRAGKEQIFTDSTATARPPADHQGRDEPLSELVAVAFKRCQGSTVHRRSRGAIELTMTTHRQQILCAVVVIAWLLGRRVRQEEAAGGAADPAARRACGRPTPTRPPAPPKPVREPRPVPPEPLAEDPLASRDIDEINKNSPFQPVFFALDSSEVDGAGAAGAQRQRRDPEEVPDLGDHDRRALRRARHGRIQPGARRAARAGGADLSGVARHLRPTGSGRSATARSSRSIRATTRPRGRRTAGRTSWSPASRQPVTLRGELTMRRMSAAGDPRQAAAADGSARSRVGAPTRSSSC